MFQFLALLLVVFAFKPNNASSSFWLEGEEKPTTIVIRNVGQNPISLIDQDGNVLGSISNDGFHVFQVINLQNGKPIIINVAEESGNMLIPVTPVEIPEDEAVSIAL